MSLSQHLSDTVYVDNVRIKIEKSPTDSFQIGVIKMCNGSTRKNADTLASLIKFNVVQNDSVLSIDRAIPINTTNKFRNQSVEMIVYVPVGHQIKIDRNVSYNRIRFTGPWNDEDWNNWNDEDYYYDYGVTYVMKENGLFTLNGIPSNKVNDDNWNSDDDHSGTDNTYRYNPSDSSDSSANAREKQIQKMEASMIH